MADRPNILFIMTDERRATIRSRPPLIAGHLFPETNEEAARVLDDAILGRDVSSNGHLTKQVETA
tara:strand:+ start:63 stop:257 length:195 start_codon:yes stop_codon:yes gene_type:complete